LRCEKQWRDKAMNKPTNRKYFKGPTFYANKTNAAKEPYT
jgi:hypothetical protein